MSVPASPPPDDKKKGTLVQAPPAQVERPAQAMVAPEPSDFSIQARIRSAEHYGPLPPPELLEKYEALIPGIADRMMKLAESQTGHRQRMEEKSLDANTSAQARGQHYGLAIGVTGFALAAYVAHLGFPVIANTLCGTVLLGLVSVFIYGRKSERPEGPAKRDAGQTSTRGSTIDLNAKGLPPAPAPSAPAGATVPAPAPAPPATPQIVAEKK